MDGNEDGDWNKKSLCKDKDCPASRSSRERFASIAEDKKRDLDAAYERGSRDMRDRAAALMDRHTGHPRPEGCDGCNGDEIRALPLRGDGPPEARHPITGMTEREASLLATVGEAIARWRAAGGVL